LVDNALSEIDLVKWRTNTRTQSHHKLRDLASKVAVHGFKSPRDNFQRSALCPRVHKTYRAARWIHNENRAAVGGVDPQAHIFVVGNQRVSPRVNYP
jgi:hypothetical protein